MPHVLVTGVSGFIGPHIVEHCISLGWRVTGVDLVPYEHPLSGFTFLEKDLRDLIALELKGVDYIVHLAFITNISNSIQNPIETTRENIDMTVRLLDLATKNGIKKVIFPSTASLYGNNPTPWQEGMPPDPIEPYSWQK